MVYLMEENVDTPSDLSLRVVNQTVPDLLLAPPSACTKLREYGTKSNR
jgi:hypothetical protein